MTKFKAKRAKGRTLFVSPGRTYRLAIPRKGKRRAQIKKIVRTVKVPKE